MTDTSGIWRRRGELSTLPAPTEIARAALKETANG